MSQATPSFIRSQSRTSSSFYPASSGRCSQAFLNQALRQWPRARLSELQEDPHPRVSSLGPLTDPSFGCCHRDCGHRVQGVVCSFFPVVKIEAASGDCPLQGLLNCLKEIPEARDRHPSPSGASDPQLREDPGAWKRNSGGKGCRLGRETPGHHLLPFSAPSRPSTTRHSGSHVSVSAGVARRWGSCYRRSWACGRCISVQMFQVGS